MTSNDSLQPIRRIVGESVVSLKGVLFLGTHSDRLQNVRHLRFENLEKRRELSGNGLGGDTSSDSGFVASEDEGFVFGMPQADSISYVKLVVNGTEDHELTSNNNLLEVARGDLVEVVEIGIETTNKTGVFAAEGYPNKIGDRTSASLIDYNDGRFSDPSRNFAANGGNGVIRGLNNSWEVQEGWDRMTINLMHYDIESTEVAGQFFVDLQVGLPDFEFDTEHPDSVLKLRQNRPTCL
jgi:hypothetical protein